MRSDRASRDNTPGAFLFMSGGGAAAAAAAAKEGERGKERGTIGGENRRVRE